MYEKFIHFVVIEWLFYICDCPLICFQCEEERVDKSKNDSNLYDSTFSYEELIDMASDLDKGDVNHDYKVIQ